MASLEEVLYKQQYDEIDKLLTSIMKGEYTDRTSATRSRIVLHIAFLSERNKIDFETAIKRYVEEKEHISQRLGAENIKERNYVDVYDIVKKQGISVEDATTKFIEEINEKYEEYEKTKELVEKVKGKYDRKLIERRLNFEFNSDSFNFSRDEDEEEKEIAINSVISIAERRNLDINTAVRVYDQELFERDSSEFINQQPEPDVLQRKAEIEESRRQAQINTISGTTLPEGPIRVKTIADIQREESIQEAAQKESGSIGYTSMSRTATMTMNPEAGRAPIASAPVGSAVRILEPQIITNNYNPNVSNAALISSAPGASDQLNGGIRDWLKNQSAAAPLVDINKEVQQQRAAHEINKMVLTQSIIQGNADAYAKIQMYRDKLKKRAYRPQSRINEVPQFLDTMDMPYLGEMGTAGLPSNQPDRVNWVRDDTKIVTRGQIYPILNPDGTAASMKGVINGRSDFMENPNAHMYPPATEGSNMRLQPMHLGIGQGKIWGNRIPAPIGGPTFDTPVATPPPNRGLVRATDFFKHLPHGHQMKKTFGYSTHGAYGPNYVTSLSKAESQEIHGALKREAPLHATRLLPQTDNVYFSG